MRCVQVLSVLALKRLLRYACQPVGRNGSGRLGADKLAPAGHHLSRALRQANARAWTAAEVLLAGEELWERAQLTWERNLEEEFFRPIRTLLDEISLHAVDERGPEARRKCSQALQAALASALLTSGPLDIAELLPEIERVDEGLDESQTEWQSLERLMDQLDQAGYTELRPLFALRCESGEPFLVVLIAALFRQAVEADADLFGSLGAACADSTLEGIQEDFRPLAAALDRHRSRLDSLLRSLREPGNTQATLASVDMAGGLNRLGRGITFAQRGDYDQAIGEYTTAIQLDPASMQAFLQRADAYRLKGDYGQALADYSAALRLDPANALALLQRGQVHWTMGQVEEAIADFTAALQLDPKNAVAYHYRGKALADAGDLDGAVVNFSEALRLDPYYAWAYHDSGEAYLAQKHYDRAIGDYSEAIRLNPLATLSHLRRGDAYAAKKEFDRAIADYGNALRLDPHNVLGYQSLGVAYRELGKYEQAAAEFTRALELDFSNGRLYLERGVLLQMQGNHERALLDFSAAASRNPKDAETYFRRGLSHDALGDRQSALTDLSQALRLQPTHAGAYNARGLLYAARGETDLAIADYNSAVGIDSAFTDVYVNRAKALAASGRLDEALADCDKALRSEPELSQGFLVRGSVQAQRGEFARAIEDFSRTLRAEPLNAHAFYMRGVAYLKHDDPRQAVVDLTEAIRLDPNHARAYAQRAAIRQATGLHELALSDLAHAARLDAQLAPAYCRQLGVVHAAMGQYEWAVADYTLALSLDPDNAAARQGRESAWQAYLKAPRKRQGPHRGFQQLGTRVPPLFSDRGVSDRGDASAVAPAPARPPETTAMLRPQETMIGHVGLETGEMPAPEPAPETAGAESTFFRLNVPQTGAADDDAEGAPDLSFALNLPGQRPTSNPEATALYESGLTLAAGTDDSLSISAMTGSTEVEAPKMERPSADRDDDTDTEDTRKAREATEQANRARMAEDFRRAEEERKRNEKETAKKAAAAAAKKAKQRRAADDDDDDGLPKWKKGVLVAASLFILYWTTTTAWGFISTKFRLSRPGTVVVTGTLVSDKDNKPLSDVRVQFLPDGDTRAKRCAGMTKKDGTFILSTFNANDGAVPGKYVVTVSAYPGAVDIPPEYAERETTPLKFEITNQDPMDLGSIKVKL
jgi:tetratricopeptide (TPR) repeat protein